MSNEMLTAVRASLAETFTPDGVARFLASRNRMLEMRTPIELIMAGEGQRVLDLAESFTGMIAT